MVLLVGAGGGGWTPAKIPWAICVMLLSLGLTTSIWLLLRSARKYLLIVGSGSNQLISNETSGFAPARIAVVSLKTSSLLGASWVKAGTPQLTWQWRRLPFLLLAYFSAGTCEQTYSSFLSLCVHRLRIPTRQG